MSEAVVRLPPKLVPVFAQARGSVRFRGAHGGRGSAKSFSFAKMAAVFGIIEPLRFLCTRDIQASIKESFHAELKNAINSEPWLQKAYDVGRDYLRSTINDTEFLFAGLRHNISSIKSMAQIDICIVEEAEDVAEESWVALEPTIRAPKSEIWPIWNPKLEGSPVDTRFRVNTAPRAAIVELNYRDNPWFPAELEELRQTQKRDMDDDTYQWIWEGKYLKKSKASILGSVWEEGIRFPTSEWAGPYHGLDFGFSQDPTASVRCWISPDDRELYVDRECGQVSLELDDTAKYLKDHIPGIEKHSVYADSARPESISHLKKATGPNGQLKRDYLPLIEGAKKGQGSVEDGIAHIKMYKVIIHPACPKTQDEFRKYSYKQDRLTGEVLPDIVDKFNHYVDALRYALEKVMRSKGSMIGMLIRRNN